jgi:hypothetical protein
MSGTTARKKRTIQEWREILEKEREESEISQRKTEELISASQSALLFLTHISSGISLPTEEYSRRVPRNFPTNGELLSNLVPTEINPCAVCLTNVPNWVILPCGHTNCGKCILELHDQFHWPRGEHYSSLCPRCRAPIEEVIKIYI